MLYKLKNPICNIMIIWYLNQLQTRDCKKGVNNPKNEFLHEKIRTLEKMLFLCNRFSS